MILKKIMTLLKNYYQKIWWINILYPFLLSILLFAALTWLIYSGQRHRRISALIEKKLISLSLFTAGPREIKNKESIVTVTLKPSDLAFVEHNTLDSYTDALSEVYAQILRNLLLANVSYISIQWQPILHQSDQEYQLILDTLKKYQKPATQVEFGIYPSSIKAIPKEFVSQLNIKESDPCQLGETQTLCIYNLQWSNWLMQAIPGRFWKEKDQQALTNKVISNNLPQSYPTYLLFHNDPDYFIDYSFEEIIHGKFDPKEMKNKAVFIGNGLIQGRDGTNKTFEPIRIRSVFTPKRNNIRVSGVPLHLFWAQQAQLFIDNGLVQIASVKIIIIATVIVIIIVLLSLVLFNAPIALGNYLLITIMAPFVNGFSIRYFQFYLPAFDCLYFGLMTFLETAFLKISLETYYQWKLTLQQNIDSDTLDSKGNFISLISHNLNTPVAKMQGMLSLIVQFFKDEDIVDDAKKALFWSTKIQLCIRSVLVHTALEENCLNHEAMNLISLVKEFHDFMGGPLKKLGIEYDICTTCTDSDMQLIPLRFDKRALLTSLGNMMILMSAKKAKAKAKIKLDLEVLTNGHEERLSLRMTGENTWFSPRIQNTLLAKIPQQDDDDLLEVLALKLLQKTMLAYKGSFIDWQKKQEEAGYVHWQLIPHNNHQLLEHNLHELKMPMHGKLDNHKLSTYEDT